MAVRPLPRQSTMPLPQVHMAGQEPEERVQESDRPASPWPEGMVGGDLGASHARASTPRHGVTGGDRADSVSLNPDKPEEITENDHATLWAPRTQHVLAEYLPSLNLNLTVPPESGVHTRGNPGPRSEAPGSSLCRLTLWSLSLLTGHQRMAGTPFIVLGHMLWEGYTCSTSFNPSWPFYS